MDKLEINSNLNETFSLIENDIKTIQDLINNIDEVMNSFDESTWKSLEKDKIDAEFLPYLKLACKYPLKLQECLNFSKNALEQYEELDTSLSKKITNEMEIL